MMATQRSRHSVPGWIRWLLPLVLLAQIGFRLYEPAPSAVATNLPPPPGVNTMHLAAVGEPIGMSVASILYLQAFDTQPGISVPFRDLDYDNLTGWLDTIIALDPISDYPLLLASQVYSQVPNETKQRAILRFVHKKFLENPVRRWRWLAHAAIVARHRLNDPRLALTFAEAIATQAKDPAVPAWARQMHIFLLEDLGEHEAARILLGGLLASGTITDEHEMRFLMDRLNAIENAEISSSPSKP